MERKETVSIGDVLRECLEKSSMQGRLNEVRACDAFAAVVGSHIASLCGRPYIRDGRMTVSVSNSSLRSELNMRRGAVVRAVNDLIALDVVKEIVFR